MTWPSNKEMHQFLVIAFFGMAMFLNNIPVNKSSGDSTELTTSRSSSKFLCSHSNSFLLRILKVTQGMPQSVIFWKLGTEYKYLWE